jgi:para-nitrobenzyl esterase
MLAYWTSFIRDGVPTAPGGPEWPPFTSPESVMRFAPGTAGEFDAGAEHRWGFWQALYPEILTP